MIAIELRQAARESSWTDSAERRCTKWEGLWQTRQRLECGGFSTAFGRLFAKMAAQMSRSSRILSTLCHRKSGNIGRLLLGRHSSTNFIRLLGILRPDLNSNLERDLRPTRQRLVDCVRKVLPTTGLSKIITSTACTAAQKRVVTQAYMFPAIVVLVLR
jgi:hypothetical protein